MRTDPIELVHGCERQAPRKELDMDIVSFILQLIQSILSFIFQIF
ncbi:MAG: hypothetical protein ABIG44_11470 [Planctomycetota bacterium]